MTAATWMSLWVSTPRMISSPAGLGVCCSASGCGMLDMVVRLLMARVADGHRRTGRAVRTVTVPLLQQGPYRDTPCRSGDSVRSHSRQPTDQRQGID